uniref:Uncharacterized protein n=1 Tax=Anguilla anguilla TaxID=7936 RepID=A0A0E9QE84_ANGAN
MTLLVYILKRSKKQTKKYKVFFRPFFSLVF